MIRRQEERRGEAGGTKLSRGGKKQQQQQQQQQQQDSRRCHRQFSSFSPVFLSICLHAFHYMFICLGCHPLPLGIFSLFWGSAISLVFLSLCFPRNSLFLFFAFNFSTLIFCPWLPRE
ncbi:uncharacterized protein BO97DRAFT_219194 [Aspergillus homomorphus CBS 101889]|uniref:Uncharacterized protein n=1 Tax=Aspergillus homomorphus (strain CBS 101889) TaxID=1450537 RepID=A0A395I8U4_ASPHC|nr:hypothetical protein BO97DRAFT_219194 [Aspergillus homomorphus CBS 101889]RAL15663.1 hypothetical protein BO97DRAFT_219194 [Aspergillus homomorphus CBS 101889]